MHMPFFVGYFKCALLFMKQLVQGNNFVTLKSYSFRSIKKVKHNRLWLRLKSVTIFMQLHTVYLVYLLYAGNSLTF